MSAKEERIKRAKEIKEWLDGAERGHSAYIIRTLLLISEQNEKIIETLGGED
jgi:hypothetical protein